MRRLVPVLLAALVAVSGCSTMLESSGSTRRSELTPRIASAFVPLAVSSDLYGMNLWHFIEELGGAAGGVVGQVRKLGGEGKGVARPQEARGVGRNLDFLLGDELPGQLAAVQGFVVSQSQQLPARHGLGHLEFEHHVAVLIGAQGRLPESRFAEVGAGGDVGEVGRGGLGLGRLALRDAARG